MCAGLVVAEHCQAGQGDGGGGARPVGQPGTEGGGDDRARALGHCAEGFVLNAGTKQGDTIDEQNYMGKVNILWTGFGTSLLVYKVMSYAS